MPLDTHISVLCSVTPSSGLKELTTNTILGCGRWGHNMNMGHFVPFTDQEAKALTDEIREIEMRESASL